MQIKVVLAHMLKEFEMRLEGPKKETENLWFGATSFINPKAKVMLKRWE